MGRKDKGREICISCGQTFHKKLTSKELRCTKCRKAEKKAASLTCWPFQDDEKRRYRSGCSSWRARLICPPTRVRAFFIILLTSPTQHLQPGVDERQVDVLRDVDL